MRLLALASLLLAAACGRQANPQAEFLEAVRGHCGKAYEGRLVSTDPQDADMAAKRLVMHVRTCEAGIVRIPFHVGEDRSRTWVLTETQAGLSLKHDHRHEDGGEDAVTQYGGATVGPGTSARQEFPVDAYSIELFKREGLPQSVTNTWAVEAADDVFAYELRREGRFFRVEFDLTTPVETPPAPWGFK